MKVNKITPGFVIQTYDTGTKECVYQEFVAGDQVDWENSDGDTLISYDEEGTSTYVADVEFDETELPYQNFDMVQPKTDSTRRYLVIVEGDVDPSMHGPFATEEERDAYAKDWRERFGDHDGIYPLDTSKEDAPIICAYSGGFFEEDSTD